MDGDRVQPAADSRRRADGVRFAKQDEERRLECVFGEVAIPDRPPTDAPHHRGEPADQFGESVVGSRGSVVADQIGVWPRVVGQRSPHAEEEAGQSSRRRSHLAPLPWVYEDNPATRPARRGISIAVLLRALGDNAPMSDDTAFALSYDRGTVLVAGGPPGFDYATLPGVRVILR